MAHHLASGESYFLVLGDRELAGQNVDDGVAGDRAERDCWRARQWVFEDDAEGMDWASGVERLGAVTHGKAACASFDIGESGQSESDTIDLEGLLDLVELHDAGEAVQLPGKLSISEARTLCSGIERASKPAIDQSTNDDFCNFEGCSSGLNELGHATVCPCPIARDKFGRFHGLVMSGEVLWCIECESWSTTGVGRDGLGGPCTGLNKSNETTHTRLRDGVHPSSGASLPKARRVV